MLNNPNLHVPTSASSRLLWLKSRIYTTYVTTTIVSVSYCIPTGQFGLGGKATACALGRRDDAGLRDAAGYVKEPSFDASPLIKSERTSVEYIFTQLVPTSLFLGSKQQLLPLKNRRTDRRRIPRQPFHRRKMRRRSLTSGQIDC